MPKLSLGTIPRAGRMLHRALIGPQGLSILSGLLLAGYWFGGEGLLLFAGLTIPGLIALTSVLRTMQDNANQRDGLTGLSTRDGALARMSVLLDQSDPGRSTACFAIGIDDFNDLGKAHDYAAIEEIVQRSAERLRSVLREGDVAARIGPAEFAVVPSGLRHSDLETGVQIAARLLAAVAEPIAIGASRFYITASAGFVLPRQLPEPSAAEMLEAAESALFEARQQGRGTIRAFAPAERRPRVVPSKLTGDVPRALENGEIQAWFQPQVSTDTGKVIGFEALARWQHPMFGMIAPAEFLPAITAARCNDRLGQVILSQALTALTGWQREGLNVPEVAVNLGEEELRDPTLPERIKWELDRFDLAPERLCIEILETVLLPVEDDMITRNIAALAELGLTIDLDDFGTGNASIAAIRRFAVDRIKIDRSFVSRVDTDRSQQEMCAAILSMAERLSLGTIAEGVESLGEHAMLAQLGCGAVQGFGIAPPMPFDETLDWIRRHEAKIAEAPRLGRKVI